jgi:chromosome segregation ATPase
MKQYLPIALIVACLGLAAALFMTKRSGDAQQAADAGAITDFSNRLDSAQTQIAIGNGTIAVFSNRLDASQSAAAALSNQLTEAQSTITLNTEQITKLNGEAAQMALANQTLSTRVADLNSQMTNQVAVLKAQLASTQTNLDQLTKGCLLLEDRLRRDVGERVAAERKFNNLSALQAQIKYLKTTRPSRLPPRASMPVWTSW